MELKTKGLGTIPATLILITGTHNKVGTQTVDFTATTGTEQPTVKWIRRHRRILKWIFLIFFSLFLTIFFTYRKNSSMPVYFLL
ncbi:hypothetical protein TNCT_433831 [Trichonephila clavata]|uniref:Uncharacterized protein n=1 Tax=Trichonephila clavata TaxID=2740835 RepID=A0A8X6FCG5_TRICU|nr:hypothetical protein TNCT_433831 [Trichonephila clavata]